MFCGTIKRNREKGKKVTAAMSQTKKISGNNVGVFCFVLFFKTVDAIVRRQDLD